MITEQTIHSQLQWSDSLKLTKITQIHNLRIQDTHMQWHICDVYHTIQLIKTQFMANPPDGVLYELHV